MTAGGSPSGFFMPFVKIYEKNKKIFVKSLDIYFYLWYTTCNNKEVTMKSNTTKKIKYMEPVWKYRIFRETKMIRRYHDEQAMDMIKWLTTADHSTPERPAQNWTAVHMIEDIVKEVDRTLNRKRQSKRTNQIKLDLWWSIMDREFGNELNKIGGQA